MKFEDWWRGIRLFLKSNRVIETSDRITVILAHLRGDVAGIYIQKKLNELDKELGTQDWDNFVKEIKTTFSNKSKVADAKWKIEIFKQGYKSTEGCHNYKTSTETTYDGRGQPMDIGRSNDNFKDGKLKCFNCNKYGHMAKDC